MMSKAKQPTSAPTPARTPASGLATLEHTRENIQQLRPDTCKASAPAFPFDPATTLIRMPELEALTGLARATVYKRLKDDPSFPKPVPLSNSTARGAPVAFVLGEVQNWIRGRIAARVVAA